MKNSIFYSFLVKLVFTITLIAGLSITASSNLKAQEGLTDDFYSAPQGTFVNADVAVTRLDAALLSMKIALENLLPGSQQYLEMEAKYAYYDNIRTILLDGKTNDSAAVAKAIGLGLGIFASDLYSNFSKAFKLQLKQSAIVLLKL